MIKLIKSTFYNEAETKKQLAKFIISSKQLSFGKECEKFEKNFAKYQERKHCIFFNSGSSANFALIQALKNLAIIASGDMIAFSAVTWSTNVMPIIQLDFNPVPVDVELETLNVSSNLFKRVPLGTKVLFITNLLGFCDDIEKVADICKEKGIILIEDNCESVGTIYKGKKLGNFGLASTFSFYVAHHMSTIEGGAVCCDDDDLAQMLRIVRAHGWDKNLSPKEQKTLRARYRINSPFYSRFTFYDLGYNLRPTEINGFLGNVQLKYLDEIIKKRNENFLRLAYPIYGRTDRYVPMKFDHIGYLSNFAFPVVCKSETIKEELIKKCEGKLEIRPIVGGNMVGQPFYSKYVKNNQPPAGVSNSMIIHRLGLYFGNNPEMTTQELNTIIRIFTQ